MFRTVRTALGVAIVVAIGCSRPTVTLDDGPTRGSLAATPSQSPSIGLSVDPRIAAALADVSAERIRRTDSTLVAFGTRHTLADTLSATRGIGAARRWIYGELSSYARDCGGCLRVEYDPAMVLVDRHPQKPTVNVVNVLAILPGRDSTRVIVMGGHYDSCICSINGFDAVADAPGADDDGSGTSAVIELARVMSKRFPRGLDATIVFALYSGEEMGLLGSTHLADGLHKRGTRVEAAFTNDINGNVIAEDGSVDSTSVRIFAANPDAGPSRELGRYAWSIGSLYRGSFPSRFEVLPVWRLDRIGRGGDHSPFVRLGDAGIRVTERLENYKRQHLPTDDLAHVNFGYVANVARFDLATLASIAAAPAAPDSLRFQRDRSSGGQKWTLTWKPVRGATGYEVLLRRTFAPTHERVIAVGAATSYMLEEQLDDIAAAVRAVGPGGARSLATGITAAPGT